MAVPSPQHDRPTALGDEISIVIPAYNEETRIAGSLRRILEYAGDRFTAFEVLVVDDGSVDGTIKVVESFAHPAVRCLANPVNSGKGYSVRRGMLEARHDPILFTDADLSTPIEELEALLDEIRKGRDIAIGSRSPGRDREVRRSPLRKLLGRGFAAIVRLIALGGHGDTQCGFKMFRRHAARAIFCRQRIDRWGFDVEVLFIARAHGLTVSEVPVRWYQSEGTRLHWLTPLTMACELLRIRWNALRGRYR
jgi:glycosyltransferase involved in cell wall biosynthesis